MDDFEKELKTGFLAEAEPMLADIEQCFLTLENDPANDATLEKIFRIAHNFKGSSKAVGFDQMGHFTHQFENFLLGLKNKEFSATPAVVNLLLRCCDQIRNMIAGLNADLNAQFDLNGLIQELNHGPAIASTTTTASEAVEAAEAPSQDLIPEPEAEVEPEGITHESPRPELALVQSDPAHVPAAAVAPAKSEHSAKQNGPEESIRVSLTRLDKLLNFVGELSILQTVLSEQVYGSNHELLRKTAHQLSKVSKEVQDISMSLRMVPIKQTFQKMQRIVRDTAGTLGKKVRLDLVGEETELDKTVLEAISDPLVHLIRNAVDHGIEQGDVRLQNGKPEKGTVSLSAYHESGKMIIEIRDDGGGICGEKLVAKAKEKGILKPNANLSEAEAVHLIFHPGFSTKSEVSEVSGRGVGMDVVKTNIEKLQGEVLVDTKVGKGTTFKIVLPVSLAIIDGMVVQIGGDRFVIPLSHVHETVRPRSGELTMNTGIGELLQLRGEIMPAYRLAALLGRAAAPEVSEEANIALIIRNQGNPFALLVDEVLRQQQIVIKGLGRELQGYRGYSGSAILGDGRPALIIEANELVTRFRPKDRAAQNQPQKQRGLA